MLLIDGVKYQEWTPELEEELEDIVEEHALDIFGQNSIYFDKKQKLKTLAGVGSIPDGLVIRLGETPQWRIVEVELSSHDPYDHVVPQVDKFINAIDNLHTRNKIIEALYSTLNNDELLRMKTKQAIGSSKDIHKFLSDLIAEPPVITIIIEKETDELKEALKKYPQQKVVEFKTYLREGADAVHVHSFEPLFISEPPGEKDTFVSGATSDIVEIELNKTNIRYTYLPIGRKYADSFPPENSEIDIVTDIGTLRAQFYFTEGWGRSISSEEWFKAHPKLKVGDKVVIAPLDVMKKYSVEIVK